MTTIRIDEKDSSLLTVSFAEDSIGNDLIRQVPGRRWSYFRRCWLVPNTDLQTYTAEQCAKLGETVETAFKNIAECISFYLTAIDGISSP